MNTAINQLLVAGGLTAIIYGISSISPAAGWIAGGLVATWIGVGSYVSDQSARRAAVEAERQRKARAAER